MRVMGHVLWRRGDFKNLLEAKPSHSAGEALDIYMLKSTIYFKWDVQNIQKLRMMRSVLFQRRNAATPPKWPGEPKITFWNSHDTENDFITVVSVSFYRRRYVDRGRMLRKRVSPSRERASVVRAESRSILDKVIPNLNWPGWNWSPCDIY